jgi:hypothetical protein
MNDSKQEGKASLKNKVYVLVCLAIGLLGVAFLRSKFPGLRNGLSDFLFIAALLMGLMYVFQGKK